jgi:xanthine dehydrogenase accessory factor
VLLNEIPGILRVEGRGAFDDTIAGDRRGFSKSSGACLRLMAGPIAVRRSLSVSFLMSPWLSALPAFFKTLTSRIGRIEFLSLVVDASSMEQKALKHLVIIIKGAGEMATGVASRLFRANLRQLLMLEARSPLAIRRRVSFCEAIHDHTKLVEDIEAVRVADKHEALHAWDTGKIAVRADPDGDSVRELKPEVLIDATLAKRNLGISMADAPLVVALGPGFIAGRDCHVVVETNRGHNLGRVITKGAAEANTGVPGTIGGYTKERVLRSPGNGLFIAEKQLGDAVRKGEAIGRVGAAEVRAEIDGILRGLIRANFPVTLGLKIGDIDPRGHGEYCDTISDKARAVGGAVLETILAAFNR